MLTPEDAAEVIEDLPEVQAAELIEDLSPGKHTLQLLMADYNHIPHDPPMYSKKITIIVPPY